MTNHLLCLSLSATLLTSQRWILELSDPYYYYCYYQQGTLAVAAADCAPAANPEATKIALAV